MKALVLDLRNNPGGLLVTAVELAELFLEPGRMITYTEGRLRDQRMRFSAHARKPYTTLPMAVLVNRGSAAASEIVAGALYDWKRASVIGAPTLGRSAIQTIIPIADGAALRLTTANWFTPTGQSVHGRGVQPHHVVEARTGTVPAPWRGAESFAQDPDVQAAKRELTRRLGR